MPRFLIWALALSTFGCSTRALPTVKGVSPSFTQLGDEVDVTVSGDGFARLLYVDLDRPSQSVVDDTFALDLDGVGLGQVRFVDTATLTAHVPATLAVGTYGLHLVDPDGRTATLADAFTVVDSNPDDPVVHLETAGGGNGTEVGDVQVRVGQTVTLFAVARWPDGGFETDVATGAWTLSGAGALTPSAGAKVGWTSSVPGSAQVQVSDPLWGDDATGTLTAVPCASAADCADPCSSTASCVAGACVIGPSTLDADRDGYIDARCAGGNDCDDRNSRVHPGATEGPVGDRTCSDGRDNDCDGLIDLAEPSCMPNTPPRARLTLTPQAVVAGGSISGSSAGSSDREDPASALTLAWDWNADGLYEATGATTAHTFATAGRFPVVLRVTDTAGAPGFASAIGLVAASAADLAIVTTGVDENNPGATPAAPGGAGFSLREAVAWAATTPGAQMILIPAGTRVALTSTLDVTGSGGVDILGNGAIVDGSAIGGTGTVCIQLSGAGVRIDGLEITGCPGAPIHASGTGDVVTRCRLHHNGRGVEWVSTNGTFGPENEVFACGSFGVQVESTSVVVGNLFHDVRGPGVTLSSNADGSTVVGNMVFASDLGIEVRGQCRGAKLWHNTVNATRGNGFALDSTSSNTDVRDNISTANQGYGLDTAGADLAALDANDLYQNRRGQCRRCPQQGQQGQRTLAVSPQYIDAAAGDLRILSSSPLVNAGVNVGLDRNGPAPGNFNGSAPDIGAFETP